MHRHFHALHLAFTLLIGLSAARGQFPANGASTPARQHSVSIEVKLVGSGGAAKASTNAKQETGRYTGAGGEDLSSTVVENKTDQNHRIILENSVRNFSAQPDQVQLEIYFFAQPVNGTKEFIFDSSTKDLSLQGGENQVITVASKEATTTVINKTVTIPGYDATDSSSVKESGIKLKGWMVRTVADGKVIQVRASQSKYEEIGRDDKKLNALKASPRKGKG